MQLIKKSRFFLLAFFIFVSYMVNGCSNWGDVSQTFRIDQGSEPENQDNMVRFRTTYYFRVVDSCKMDDGITGSPYEEPALSVFQVRRKGKLKIVNDSLYRFRMTGKGSALYSTIHFESGVLREEQIDPFGSTVKYNQEIGAYRVESGSQIRERARREVIIEEIKKLNTLKTKLNSKYDSTIEPLIKKQLGLLAIENDSGITKAPKTTTEGKASYETNILCPDGRPIMQSYYLYGPEGVRKLDPDERLLMAMAVDSKPLISMLQQLSGKKLQSQQINTESFREIVVARAKVLDSLTKVIVEKEKDNDSLNDLSTLLVDLKNQFSQPKPKKVVSDE